MGDRHRRRRQPAGPGDRGRPDARRRQAGRGLGRGGRRRRLQGAVEIRDRDVFERGLRQSGSGSLLGLDHQPHHFRDRGRHRLHGARDRHPGRAGRNAVRGGDGASRPADPDHRGRDGDGRRRARVHGDAEPGRVRRRDGRLRGDGRHGDLGQRPRGRGGLRRAGRRRTADHPRRADDREPSPSPPATTRWTRATRPSR